jgi:hypothetical protein
MATIQAASAAAAMPSAPLLPPAPDPDDDHGVIVDPVAEHVGAPTERREQVAEDLAIHGVAKVGLRPQQGRGLTEALRGTRRRCRVLVAEEGAQPSQVGDVLSGGVMLRQPLASLRLAALQLLLVLTDSPWESAAWATWSPGLKIPVSLVRFRVQAPSSRPTGRRSDSPLAGTDQMAGDAGAE